MICKILPNDVLIASYAKSGRTWIRFFIANYLSNVIKIKNPEINWNNFASLTPSQYCNSSDGLLAVPYDNYPKDKSRFIFSHDKYFGNFFAGNQVILLTRNIFDIILSSYHFNTYRANPKLANITLDEYALKVFNFNRLIQT